MGRLSGPYGASEAGLVTLMSGLDRQAPMRSPAFEADALCDRVVLDHAVLRHNGVIGFDKGDRAAQPFFMARSQLLKRVGAVDARVLAVTSTRPGDGKTHVAVNLAAALSYIRPAILVDLDLRRPSLAGRLGLLASCGVDDVLAGEAFCADTAMRVDGHALTIHGARMSRDNASELLAGPQLPALMDELRAAPGQPIILVDTPPVLVLDDIALIARVVDGILLVVEEGRTGRAELLDAVRLLEPKPIIGSVLNRSMSAGLRSRDYDYYYPKHG